MQLLLLCVTWVLTYLVICNAASASATFVKGTASANRSVVSAPDNDTLSPQSNGPLTTVSPVITATKTDAFAPGGDVNGNGLFDPGDTIQYTVIISNTGSGDATGVQFSDNPDTNTTLVPGSLSASPVAVDDAYTATGNLSISIAAGSGVLANDYMGLNPAATISVSDTTSTNAGTVTVNADGSFSYEPAAGFTGADTFHYTLSNSTGSSVGTVTVTVSNRIWFINNAAGACSSSCNGRLSHPFAGLSSFIAAAVDASGDVIFIYQGTGSYAGALTLKTNERLIGQGDALNAITLGFTPAPNGPALPGATGNPTLTGTLTLAGGVTVLALNLSTGTSNGMVGSGSISGITVGDGLNVTTSTGTAVSLTNVGGAFTFKSISANGGTNGIVLSSTTGSFTVTGNGGSCTSAGTCTGGSIQNTTIGVSLSNAASVSLDRMFIQNTTDSGVKGTTVTDFSFTNGKIDASGTAGGTDTSNIAFNNTGAGTEQNLTGNVTITGNTLTNAHYQGVDIFNYNGTISNLNVSNNTLTSYTTTGGGGTTSVGSGIRIVAFGSASTVASITTATLDNNIINNFPGAVGINVQCGNANSAAAPSSTCGTPGNATNVIAITNDQINKPGNGSTVKTGGEGIIALVNGVGQGNFNISGNNVQQNTGTSISSSAFGNAQVTEIISGNVVVSNNTVASQGIGVGTSTTGVFVANSPHLTTTIKLNNVSQTDGNGILAVARDSQSGKLDAAILTNTVAAPLSGVRPGIRIDAGNGTSVDDDVCLNIAGNTSAGSGNPASTKQPGIGLRKQGTSTTTNAFGVVGMAATGTPGVETFVNGLNPGSAGGGPTSGAVGGTVLISASSGFSNCSSAPTGMLPIPQSNHALVMQTEDWRSPEVASVAVITDKFASAHSAANISDTVIPNLKFTGALEPRQPGSTASPLLATAPVPLVFVNAGTLNPGKSVTIKFQVTINNPWTGGSGTTVSNQGTVSGSNFSSVLTDDPTVSGGSDPTVTPIFLPADLVVAKTHAGNFRQGDVGDVYTITVSNIGIGATSGTVYVTDTLPSGLTASGLGGTGWLACSIVSLTCSRGDLLPISFSYPALLLTVNVSGTAPALVTNTVTVGGGGEITSTNDIATDPTTIIQVADLTVAKTHNGNFTQGGTGDVYTVTVSNVGPGPTLGTVSVSDTLPSGLTATGFSGTGWLSCSTVTLTCNRSDVLANGSSYPAIVLTVDVSDTAPALVTNTVTVAGGGEINTANDSANDQTSINQFPDLTVAKTHHDPFRQGDVGDVYTITVSNNGLAATTGTVNVTDTLPNGLTATGWVGTGWACAPLTPTCQRSDSLSAGGSYPVILLTVTVGFNAPAVVTNTVTVSGGGELVTGDDSAGDLTHITPAADLSIAKTHNDPFKQGDVGDIYTITVSNAGFAPTAGTATVTDTLPSGLTATAIGGGPNWSCTLSPLSCSNSGELSAGNSYPAITLTVNVAVNAPPVVTNTATVTGGGDVNPSNNTAYDLTNIQGADLVVAKTHTGYFTQGDVGDVYTITVSNIGSSATTATVYVTDTLPGDLTGTGFGGAGWSCTLSPLACSTTSALAPGGSYPVITLTVDVANNAPAVVTNTVTVAGGGEAVTSNDTANDQTQILALADLEVQKLAPASVLAGAQLTYTIVITNHGPGDAQSVVLTDTLPAGTSYVSQQQTSGPAFNLSHLGNAITDTISTFAAGASATFQAVVQVGANVPNNSSLGNTATATSPSPDPSPNDGNNTATVSTTVTTLASVSLSKSAPATVVAGTQLTYTLIDTNAGPSDAQNGVLTDSLPAGTTYVSQSQTNGPSFTLTHLGNAITDTIATLAAGASATFQVVVQVGADVVSGTVLGNSAATTSGTAGGGASASASTTVARQVDLRVTKTGSIDPVAAGSGSGNLTYVVTVTNNGPSDASGVSLSEVLTLPSGVSIVSITPSSGSYAPPNGANGAWSVGSLSNGSSATLTVVLTVGASAASGTNVITDTATVTASNEPRINPGDDSATLATSVTRRVDLQVSKTGPASVSAGSGPGNLTYVVTVTNDGPSDASGVSLSEALTLPSGVSIDSITPSSGSYAPPNGANGTWTVGNLPRGSSATLTVVLTVGPATAAGTDVIADTATVNGANETLIDSGDDSATRSTSVTTQADLQVSKSAAATVSAGTQLTYTIVVSNAGLSDAQNVVLTDTLPAGTTYVSQSQTNGPAFTLSHLGNAITDTISTLAAGASATFQVVVQVNANVSNGSVLGNTATVSSSTTDLTPGSNTATVSTTVQAQADLQAGKSASATVVAGTQMTYTISVSNAGPSDAQNVVLSDTLPGGTTYFSQIQLTGPAFTLSHLGNAVTDTISTLASGASATFQVVVQANANAANGSGLANTAVVTDTTADPTPGNNTATVNTTVQAQADVQLSKTGPATVAAGANLTYSLIVTNNGPSDAQSVVLTDTLPAGTSFVSQQQTTGPAFTPSNVGNAISDTLITLAAGASASFQVVAQVGSNVPGGTVLSNTAGVTSTTSDQAPANNSAGTGSTVQTLADLQVSKNASSPVLAGAGISYTLIVTNAGPSDAQNVVLSDTLPAGTTFVSQQQTTGPSFVLFNSGNAITDTIASLPAGSVARFNVGAAVSIGVPDLTVITNTTTITSDTTDPLGGNNSASITSTVRAGADLSVAKAGPATVTAGTNLTYTLVVRNGGPLAADAVVTDVLPLSVTFQSVVSVSTAAGSPTCQQPTAGQNGTLVCQQMLAAGDITTYTVVTNVPANVPAGTVFTNTATVASPATPDVVPGNNTSAPVQTQVTATADLLIVKRANSGTAIAGDLITYTIVVTNIGPSFAANVVLSDVLPLSETFRSLSSPAGWTCNMPAVGANGTVTCSKTSLGLGAVTFTLVAKLNYGNALINTHVVNQATVTSDASDPTTPNVASADVLVNGAAVFKQYLPLILRQIPPGGGP
jgi:uncharacterized repeat protein (TIGR01451 family)